MHKPIFEDRITIDRKKGEIVRIVNARSNQKIIQGLKKGEQTSFDCFKQYEDSPSVCRNLYRNFYNYLRVEFPKELVYNYKTKRKVRRGYDDWEELCCTVNLATPFKPTKREIDLICMMHPNFRYVMNKWCGTRFQVMQVLECWKKHPEIELPLSLGYYDVCFSKQFYNLNKEQLKICYKFMNENRGLNMPISGLMDIIKYGEELAYKLNRAKAIMARRVKVSEVDWILSQHEKYPEEERYKFKGDVKTYYDLCNYFHKDMKDEYWLHPKNMYERLADLRQQRENIRKIEDVERAKKRMERYTAAIKKLENCDRTINGYSIIVPKTVEQWEKQAEVLNQCIIRMDYMNVVTENHVLFFILKGDTPIATCEVTDLLEKKIGEFYADEHDRSNCLPTPEVRNAILKYLDELKVS